MSPGAARDHFLTPFLFFLSFDQLERASTPTLRYDS